MPSDESTPEKKKIDWNPLAAADAKPGTEGGVSAPVLFIDSDVEDDLAQPDMLLEELASQNTTEMRAARNRADQIAIRAERWILPDAPALKEMCDSLDVIMAGDDRYDEIDLRSIRNYVRTIMVTLKAKPEFKEVLLDSNVRSVVKYMREAYLAAKDSGEVLRANKAPGRKAGVKSKSKAMSSKKMDALAAAFDLAMKG